MRLPVFTTLVVAGLSAVAIRTAAVGAAQAPTKSTWDGVYTESQAGAGQILFADKCGKCHGPSGTGGDAPDLVGNGFSSNWDGQPITGLFDRTRVYMPQDAPGSLSREQTSQITAFLLKLNEFPAGTVDFPSSADALNQINYVAVKPAVPTAAVAPPPGAPAAAAAAAPASTAPHREFEVATIKPSADQPERANIGVRISGSQVRVNFLSLKDYIGLAYGLRSGQVTAPDWVSQERFDISAKFPDDVQKGDFAPMLESLLVDRFRMKVHRESREFPVYELAVAKGGPKLHEADLADAVPVRPGTTNVTAAGSAQGLDMDLGGGASFSLANNKLEIRKMTMASLADSFTRLLDRPVIDKTGLTGIYDLTIDLTPEDYTGVLVRSAMNAGVVLPPQALRALDFSAANPLGAPLEKYGLTFEAKRAPLDIVVVDSMEKTPKEN